MSIFFSNQTIAKLELAVRRLMMKEAFALLSNLENCDDMLYWLLACKITFACYLQDCEQKNNHVPPSEF